MFAVYGNTTESQVEYSVFTNNKALFTLCDYTPLLELLCSKEKQLSSHACKQQRINLIHSSFPVSAISNSNHFTMSITLLLKSVTARFFSRISRISTNKFLVLMDFSTYYNLFIECETF